MSNPQDSPKTVENRLLLGLVILFVLVAIAGEVEEWQNRANGLPSQSVQGGW